MPKQSTADCERAIEIMSQYLRHQWGEHGCHRGGAIRVEFFTNGNNGRLLCAIREDRVLDRTG